MAAKRCIDVRHVHHELSQAASDTLRGGNDIGAWADAKRESPVFSHFRYMRPCNAEALWVPIEPLVGLLRHPFAVPRCLPKVPSMFHPSR
jgi:hypothetical protein